MRYHIVVIPGFRKQRQEDCCRSKAYRVSLRLAGAINSSPVSKQQHKEKGSIEEQVKAQRSCVQALCESPETSWPLAFSKPDDSLVLRFLDSASSQHAVGWAAGGQEKPRVKDSLRACTFTKGGVWINAPGHCLVWARF